MESLEGNKAVAAILTAGIAFMVTGLIGKALVSPERPHHSAIKIGEVAETAAAPAAAAAPALPPIGPLLAKADAQAGQQLAQRLCGSCHTFNQGGRHGVGPNLYGIMGAPHGHAEGFSYSAALKGRQGPWTYEDMNAWLAKPSQYAPGTRMAFAGVSNDQQRADIIAYLRSISPNAPPLPPATAPEQPAAPAQQQGAAPAAQGSAAATPAAAPAADGVQPVSPLLASANVENGERLARRLCGACHTFNQGGRNGVGPNLYNIVGAPHAHAEGFSFSAALKGKQGPWSYEELNAWLAKPSQYAPGTRMAFAGMNDVQQRADLIAYLRTLSPNPKPLP